jgi:hypothetical protein
MVRLYEVYGTAVLLLLAGAHVTGWSRSSATEVKGVPRSIRNNPGAYRTHYVGGK